MRMKDIKASMLQRLHRLYEEKGGNVSLLPGIELEMELGVNRGVPEVALRDLAEKGLVEFMGRGARLTARGVEQIEEPGTEAFDLANLVVNVSGGNVQVGSNNQQVITYQSVLTSLADRIEAEPDIPPDQKRSWTTTLRDIAKHPATVAIVSAAASAAAGTLSK